MKSPAVTFIFAFSVVLTHCFLTPQLVLSQTELAAPKPSMDTPRKIVMALNSFDENTVNNILFNIVNIQKFYGQVNVEIAVVSYGAGVRNLIKGESKVADRIQSLILYDVNFIACGNTLDAIGKNQETLIDGVNYVQAGLPEIIEKQLSGWVYLKP